MRKKLKNPQALYSRFGGKLVIHDPPIPLNKIREVEDDMRAKLKSGLYDIVNGRVSKIRTQDDV